MMKHPSGLKANVCQMYKEGMPRRQIQQATGIPIRTIYDWTQFILSESLAIINCVVCGKKAKSRHADMRKYCSERCRQRAKYRRTRKPPKLPRRCVECGKPFEASNHSHSYCTKRCKNRAAQKRRRNDLRKG